MWLTWQVYKAVRQDLEQGGQAFIVCPLVEASKNEATAHLTVRPTRFRGAHMSMLPELSFVVWHASPEVIHEA